MPGILFFRAAGLLLLAFSFCGPLSVTAPAAARVDIVGSEKDGFGRLVFRWPRHEDKGLPQTVPEYEILTTANVLVMHFGEAFEKISSETKVRLPRYIALMRQDPDGKTLRIALKADFAIHTLEAGNELYVDLLPSNWRGSPPSLPKEVTARLQKEEEERKAFLAKIAEEGAEEIPEIVEPERRLDLRVAENDVFTRLVFDWNEPVLYSIAQREGRVTITFDRAVELPLARLRVDPPRYLLDARSTTSSGRLTVFLRTEPGVIARDFREELNVVLDIGPPGRGVEDIQVSAEKANQVPGITQPDWGEGETRPAQTEKTVPREDNTSPEDPKASVAQHSAAKQDSQDGNEVNTTKKEAAQEGEGGKVTAQQDKVVPEKTSTPSQQQNPSVLVKDDGSPLPLQASIVGKSVRLFFPWPKRVGAAAFERNGRIWIVFDHARPLDLTGFPREAEALLGKPEIIPVEEATVVQFRPPGRVLLSAAEKGSHWIFTLGDMIIEPTRPITLSRGWTESGEATVSLDMKGRGRVYWIRDPDIRDVLAIITANGPPQGLISPRNFVEFSVLASVQGLVLRSVSDDLYVRADKDEVVVSRGTGLTLSSKPVPDEVSSKVSDPVRPGRMDFVRWRNVPGDSYVTRRQYYLQKLAQSAETGQVEARVDFARFLMGHGLGHETLAVLRMVENTDSDITSNPEFRALRGVAMYKTGRYDEAVSELSVHALSQDPHAALWRGAAYAAIGNMRNAKTDFERAEQVFADYEPHLQAMFRVRTAQAELAAGDLAAVSFNLSQIPQEDVPERWQAEARLVQAQLLKVSSRTDAALEILDRLADNENRHIATRGRFIKARLQNELGLLDDEGFIGELNRLKFMWRGDKTELAILEQLGERYVESGKVHEGLQILQQAVSRFPDTDRGRRIASTMTDIFSNLFLGNQSDDLEPIDALSLYYDFRELTPIGRRGDAMIRKLADKLVSVDLLDQASELLQHQVDHRLRGIAKSQVATKLALIRLMSRDPEKALEAIRSTRQNLLPENLRIQRRLLEARALADLDFHDHALDLLGELDSADARQLEADVYWEAQRWEEAGSQLEELLGTLWNEEKLLDDDSRFMVMRAAISYSLADEPLGLERLRTKFGKKMRLSPDAAAFSIVTEPIESQGMEFRKLAREIAQRDTLNAFIRSMRSKSLPDPGEQDAVSESG